MPLPQAHDAMLGPDAEIDAHFTSEPDLERLLDGIRAQAGPGVRYRDGGPGPEPGQRWVRFESRGGAEETCSGALLLELGTGRILLERSHRHNPVSMIRSESRIVHFGEVAPEQWQEVEIRSLERWVTTRGESMIQRHTCVTSRPCAPEGGGAEMPFTGPEGGVSTTTAGHADPHGVQTPLPGTRTPS